MDASDPPVRRSSNRLAIAAIVLGALGAMAAIGAGQRAVAAESTSSAEDVWRSTLGSWLLVGYVVDLGRAVLLVLTGVGLMQRATWTRRVGFAYAGVTFARVLFGFYLVQDSLQPALVKLGVGRRSEQLLGAYVEGQLMTSMVLGIVSLALAVGVAWVMSRQSAGSTE